MKRFVRVANSNVVVGGRLITIEGVSYSSDRPLFPKLKAEITATVYLSPKAEGATAGATPAGPADDDARRARASDVHRPAPRLRPRPQSRLRKDPP